MDLITKGEYIQPGQLARQPELVGLAAHREADKEIMEILRGGWSGLEEVYSSSEKAWYKMTDCVPCIILHVNIGWCAVSVQNDWLCAVHSSPC